MGEPRDRDWVRTLDEVEAAVRGCLAALDRYEARFHELLDAQPAAPRPAPKPPPTGWGESLDRAGRETAAVEHLLAEQEAAWARWREALSSWRQSVEQSPGRAVAGTT